MDDDLLAQARALRHRQQQGERTAAQAQQVESDAHRQDRAAIRDVIRILQDRRVPPQPLSRVCHPHRLSWRGGKSSSHAQLFRVGPGEVTGRGWVLQLSDLQWSVTEPFQTQFLGRRTYALVEDVEGLVKVHEAYQHPQEVRLPRRLRNGSIFGEQVPFIRAQAPVSVYCRCALDTGRAPIIDRWSEDRDQPGRLPLHDVLVRWLAVQDID